MSNFLSKFLLGITTDNIRHGVEMLSGETLCVTSRPLPDSWRLALHCVPCWPERHGVCGVCV